MRRIFKLSLSLMLMITVTSPVTANASDCVIFLHGLARTSDSMQVMANAFQAQGYKVANIDYPSRKYPIQTLAPMAVNEGLIQCGGSDKVHFITHSLGGILVRYYLQHYTVDNLGKVVMLAPPNQGSEVTDNYRNIVGYEAINGPAGMQLGTDSESVPVTLDAVDFELGVIAGTKTFNPILSLSLPNPDDGKVSVENTKVDGMQDFIAVPYSHPFIMKRERVINYALTFIKTGKFISEDVQK